MRKYIYFLFILFPFLTSCEEDGLKEFEEPLSSVYFYIHENPEVNEMIYSFIYTFEEEVVVKIPVKCSGMAAGYERHFRAEVVSDSTTAIPEKHYLLPREVVFPVGAYEAYLPVTLYNQDTTLRTQSFVLTLRLAESEDFELGGKERQIVRLRFSNQLVRPDFWPDWMFGTWSLVKHKRLIQIAGKDLTSEDELNADFNFWYYGVGQGLKNYFIKNYPVLDENNKIIEPW